MIWQRTNCLFKQKGDSVSESIHVYKDSEGMQLSVNSMDLEVDLEPPAPPLPNVDDDSDFIFQHSELSMEQADEFNIMLKKWRKNFQSSKGHYHQGELRLYLDETLPSIKQRYIRLSPADQEIAHKEVDRLLEEGVIEPETPLGDCWSEGKPQTRLDSDKFELLLERSTVQNETMMAVAQLLMQHVKQQNQVE